ncbi:helix-turn-helix domain-containing protein [Hymenobacter sp. IS2118]|uniref:helix-turn-helix domain-containing protein n=1 Tax=Hymenobacter sp. IS2118 TaxID=1505605 RepID=UPI00054FC9A3|nr:helix-turn-helix transcriptional regulator [Hymenobacter sp. IS2118]
MKTYSLDGVIEQYIGSIGTLERDAFEEPLRFGLLGKAIKEARLKRHLTQQQLGDLVGMQKAQISKLENSLTDAHFDTVIKVFKALDAKASFSVELLNQTMPVV